MNLHYRIIRDKELEENNTLVAVLSQVWRMPKYFRLPNLATHIDLQC